MPLDLALKDQLNNDFVFKYLKNHRYEAATYIGDYLKHPSKNNDPIFRNSFQ